MTRASEAKEQRNLSQNPPQLPVKVRPREVGGVKGKVPKTGSTWNGNKLGRQVICLSLNVCWAQVVICFCSRTKCQVYKQNHMALLLL